MVKKLRKMAEEHGSDSQLAKAIRESAQQIWLAGLGAFMKARKEGSKAFENLVSEGLNLHARTRAAAEERLGDVADRVGEVTGRVGKQASASWDRLEQVFEERVSRALSRLGVPNQTDIDAVNARIDALLAKMQAGDDRPAARGTPKQKAATKRASAKRSAAAAKKPAVAKKPAAAPKKRATVARAAKAPAQTTTTSAKTATRRVRKAA